MPGSFYYNIEILGMGQCNLRCPACPTGNYRDVENPMGIMKPELLDQIMAKAVSECHVAGVGLFNWAEPLIHPQIGEMVRAVQKYNVPCDLSSNLNDIRNLEATLLANPNSLRISLSGFTQETYGKTHRGGDIERVKANMKTLAEMKAKTGASTKIHVLYHRYKHNVEEERLMKRFAMSLGFDFVVAWAYFMPLEKLIAYIDNDPSRAPINQEDLDVIDLLAVNPKDALQHTRPLANTRCSLKDNQITLDFRGKSMLCCTLYSADKYDVGDYLTTPIAQIQNNKDQQDICSRCTKDGLHAYYTYQSPEVQVQSIKGVLNHTAKYLSESHAVGAGSGITFTIN